MGPLEGVRVLELAGMGPVPFCGMLLGDMGADVLRVDRIAPVERGVGAEDAQDLRGRNKRSAGIDLKSCAGRATLLELVAQADILIEGYRPGVMERLGLGPDTCLARNPKLVYGRATGWGQDGPLARAAGHDINYIALTGALAMIGPAGGAPVPPLNLVGDYGGGALYLAFGTVCALHHARSGGGGQVVDAAMIDGVSSLLTVFRGFLQNDRLHEGRGQNALDGGAPWYCTYETRDGGWMAVGALEQRFYIPFVTGLGLDPAALPSREDRANWPELRSLFAARFRKRSRAEWELVFAGSDACVSPVLSLAEASRHPQSTARAAFTRLDGAEHPRPAPRFSQTPATVRLAPAHAGADTQVALSDWGIDATQIRDGLAAGYLGEG
ncbi:MULTISPECIES: CaiB/BaiF CoA transferase family protein [Salipiger]|uniref:CaiB/BaiF CoA transferase family protein n=1 Tax=Salipiger TaxID=263377 RepID=UPI003517E973